MQSFYKLSNFQFISHVSRLATHLIDEIENFIDRAIILSKGLVLQDVMIDDLREQGGTLEGLLSQTLEINENKFREIFL